MLGPENDKQYTVIDWVRVQQLLFEEPAYN
jgi:hypothetical protein